MNLLCLEGDWNLAIVSIFQFVTFFRGKNLTAFIENMSHEAWITTNLLSDNVNSVRDVMSRLRNVPVVPPLESLRQIGIVLIKKKSSILIAVGEFFIS